MRKLWLHKELELALWQFANSARRVPDTEEAKTETTKSQKTQKGARNGLQETPDRGEVRC